MDARARTAGSCCFLLREVYSKIRVFVVSCVCIMGGGFFYFCSVMIGNSFTLARSIGEAFIGINVII